MNEQQYFEQFSGLCIAKGWGIEAEEQGLGYLTDEEADWINAERDWLKEDEARLMWERFENELSTERLRQLKRFLSYTFKYLVLD